MQAAPNPSLHAQIVAAFDWWRDAGVDCDFDDEPADWLARAATPADEERPEPAPAFARVAAPSVEVRTGIDATQLPTDLAGLQAWWMAEPSLDDGRATGRVAPRGPAGARVMVLVPQPEREDREHLLSGPQGKLLDAMLAAMGIAPDAAYVASALPRHTPLADWSAVAANGMGKVIAHHVSLVRPERLIVFGSNILPLLGNDPPKSSHPTGQFDGEGAIVPLLAEPELAALIERPRWKARFWRHWLDWAEAGP